MNRYFKHQMAAAAAALLLLSACQQNNSDTSNAKSLPSYPAEHYTAVYEGDTAQLTIVRKKSLMEGKLKFIYKTGVVDSGSLRGRIAGDTLYADYQARARNGRPFRNPMALLQKDNKIYLGIGQFEMAWGRAYFAKNVPIDYNKGKYVFIKAVY